MTVFKSVIQQNREVCSNCFRRIRTHEMPSHVNRFTATDPVIPIRRTVKDYFTGFYENSLNLEESDYGSACKCGSIGHSTTSRTADNSLTKPQAIELSIPLGVRLRESGVDFDGATLVRTIFILKSQPEVANCDDEIFGVSVQRAIHVNQK